MKGTEQFLAEYMSGVDKQFIIPVYQRNYDWKIEHCKQLFDDLVSVQKNGRKAHFFGSIVSGQNTESLQSQFLIIDGQQRLTTVSLLLLALYNLLEEGVIKSNESSLSERILEHYLINKFNTGSTRIRLKPIKKDSEAFERLLDKNKEHIKSSNLTINYNYFYNRIQKRELSADELFKAFQKLQIINIYLHEGDNPQLIFESLNSTGLDLSEGDKIRNYILMGITDPKEQEAYYHTYWHQIELATNFEVSLFIRDYLSIKLQSIPTFSKVYQVFKSFSQTMPFKDKEELLQDLLAYAKRYKILLNASSTNDRLNSIIFRLNVLEATVTRPFLMEILNLAENSELIKQDELIQIFEYVESYIFRRTICNIPTNALNKIFVSLHPEIIGIEKSAENYFEKFKYVLANKARSGIFPTDEMFTSAFTTKDIFFLRGRNQSYIMERFENFGTRETKDIWERIEKKVYSIEHIMPQTLNDEWKRELGPDYQKIHEEWLHRMANLTLTAYNSRYSNHSFYKKKTMENGFAQSGLRINLDIAKYEKWTLDEIVDRNNKLLEKALQIWPMIETTYKVPEKNLESVSLADDIDLTGEKLFKYSFRGEESVADTWKKMYIDVLNTLHNENPHVLYQISTSINRHEMSYYISDSSHNFSYFVKIADDLYLNDNFSTNTRIYALQKFLPMYGVDPEELIFYLKEDGENDLDDTSSLANIRKAFWEYALPRLRAETNMFLKRNPTTSHYLGSPMGNPGTRFYASSTLENTKIGFCIERKMTEQNKALYDFLINHKEEIETKAGQKFNWARMSEYRVSCVETIPILVNNTNRQNWDTIIDYFVSNINIMREVFNPYIELFDLKTKQ
jgi:uncharacterized protein with ParB-like and HNH nuclease domain